MKLPVLAFSVLLLGGCGSDSPSSTAGHAGSSSAGASGTGADGASGTGGTAASGAAGTGAVGPGGMGGTMDAGTDAPPDVPDGDPTRQTCTDGFGHGLSSSYGRLDGLLVAIVHTGANKCNGDQDHVHLQVMSKGAIYDVAVNMQSDQNGDPNVQYLEKHGPQVGDPWSEGWHTGVLFDYWGNLQTHSTEFTAYDLDTLAQKVEAALATVNHISVYGTGYGPTGTHKIHRNFVNKDGALVLEPLSNSPRYLMFHFVDQTF